MSQVEYILGLWKPPCGHSVGVNTITGAAETVISGGRDGRVCGWNPASASATMQYDAHTDWINSVILGPTSPESNAARQIWSCSNDTTVKVWRDGALTTVGAHDDYAKCLALISGGSSGDARVLSAGLDGKIMAWTLDGRSDFSVRIDGEMGSVYALAGNNAQFVSGGPDSIVRLWDSREGATVQTFAGHSGNIRSLLMNDDWIISASSDATVRCWSLRAGRLFKSWNDYSDSVFSLSSSAEDLSSWVAGDRAGQIRLTHREGGGARIVAQSGDPVWDMTQQNGALWTAGSSIRFWETSPAQNVAPTAAQDDSPSPTSTPSLPAPTAVHEMHHSLVKTLILNDKRRVLVADSTGGTALIDILEGRVLESLPRINTHDISQELSDLASKYNTNDVLDNWCNVGVRAGKLVISLGKQSAGCTEVYADELATITGHNLGEVDDEKRINLGKWTLQALFRDFVEAELPRFEADKKRHVQTKAAEAEAAPPAETPKKEKSKLSRMFSLRKNKDSSTPAAHAVPSSSPPPSAASGATAAAGSSNKRETYDQVLEAAYDEEAVPTLPPYRLADDVRVLISRRGPEAGAATAVVDCTVADMGTPEHVELLRSMLPAWVGEALWLPKMSSRSPARIGFNIVPFDENYPEILQNKGRLVANPVLRARKAMAYVIASLKEGGHLTDTEGFADNYIELYCKGEFVPPLMTLAMIRTRLWRSGGDVLLHYKLKPGVGGATAAPEASVPTA